jgi:hypothetical protein
MKITKLVFTLLFFITGSVLAQLTVSAELRPRFEYRHGFKTLFPDNTDAAAFVSQRTRLNTLYNTEKLEFYLSMQDVRVWGDVPQLNTSDKNGFSLHEAWAKISFNPNFGLKVGRQEIAYNDHRLFGNVGWAQQARSHDAAVFQYKKERVTFHTGFAYNQDAENLTETTLTTNTYKSLQYIWLQKQWNTFNGSFIFLNNGLQHIDPLNSNNNKTRYSQTLGTHIVYKQNAIQAQTNLYYQFGKDVNNNTLQAYLASIEGTYTFSNKVNASLGSEFLSGNNNATITNNKNKAFTPFYGTNHKFNGFMDYFYVGNHVNNVGLLNLYTKIIIQPSARSTYTLYLHNFSAAADIPQNNSKQLGTEVDLVFKHCLFKDVTLQAGYSHMFASAGLEIIKNNTDNNTNNWGWVMLTIKPTLFTNK